MAEGELFRATIIGVGNLGTAFVFDFGYADKAVGGTHIDTGIAAGNFQTLVQAKFAAVLPLLFTFKRYRFACVAGANAGDVGFVDVDPPVTGSLDQNTLPCEIAISVKRNTGRASRHDRGRIFLGPVVQSYQSTTNFDFVDLPNSDLSDVADLLKANLVTQGRTLNPVILSATNTTSGYTIQNTSIGQVFVHRKSRRFRVGV